MMRLAGAYYMKPASSPVQKVGVILNNAAELDANQVQSRCRFRRSLATYLRSLEPKLLQLVLPP